MNKEKTLDYTKCINCKACTRHCDFLAKYDLVIGEYEKLEKLAYHCFLCGECSRVCPKGIDGKNIILNIRKKQVSNDKYSLKEKGYNGIVLEKKNYLFKNYELLRKNKSEKTILFPGCNFPSFFPKTNKYISSLFKDKYNIDTIYDCCGKPIAELGLSEDEDKNILRLNRYFKENNITEIIVLCPNCYYHFLGKINIKITSIYEKLLEFGIGSVIEDKFSLYLPCPDRENKVWLDFINPFIKEKFSYVKDIQCCGLGGLAIVKEKEMSYSFADKLKEKNYERIYSYCATCIGNFKRRGLNNVEHFLPLILGTNERADIKNSFINRVKTKFIKKV